MLVDPDGKAPADIIIKGKNNSSITIETDLLDISDEEGNSVEQRHYDAWGNMTHLQIGSGAVLTGEELERAKAQMFLDRGYTSHEHFWEVGIIHMNGRLYDPLLRRFLNADENIQDPHNTQQQVWLCP